MSVQQLLKALRQAGVKLSVHEDKLRCELPPSGLEDGLKSQLIQQKESLNNGYWLINKLVR